MVFFDRVDMYCAVITSIMIGVASSLMIAPAPAPKGPLVVGDVVKNKLTDQEAVIVSVASDQTCRIYSADACACGCEKKHYCDQALAIWERK